MKNLRPWSSLIVFMFCSLTVIAHASSLSVYCVTLGNFVQNGGAGTEAICNPPNQPGGGPNERIEYSKSRAGYGILGDGGSAQIQNLSNYASGIEARSSFADSFTVNSRTPTSGTLLFNISIDGSLPVSGSGNATTNAGGNLTAQGGSFLSGSTGGTDTVVDLKGGIQNLVLAIPYIDSQVATDFNLTLFVYASCSVTGFGSCQAQADYYNTAVVTGYSLQNTSGVPLQQSATFASGTNYDAIPSHGPAATPEPGSFVLLGSGLTAMFGAAKTRRANVN